MISPDRIEQIFDEMDTYILQLESDPSALGPQYFQDKIAECRNHLNTVSLVTSELNREKLALSGEIRKFEALFQLDFDNLLATDEHVRKLAAIEDRKSTVQHMLRSQRQEIDALKEQLHAVEAVGKVVTLRSKELHSTMTAIRDQKRLMQSEIQTGAFYGDERVPKNLRHSEPTGGMGVDDIGADELDALLAQSEEEVVAEQAAAEAPEPTVEPTSEPEELTVVEEPEPDPPLAVVEAQDSPEVAEVLSFLDGGGTSNSSEENDIAALLDSL